MKCELPNQDATTARLYIGEAMGGEYDPPGIEVKETDDGIRYVRVKAAVGDVLIEDYGFEELAEESFDEDDINVSDNDV